MGLGITPAEPAADPRRRRGAVTLHVVLRHEATTPDFRTRDRTRLVAIVSLAPSTRVLDGK